MRVFALLAMGLMLAGCGTFGGPALPSAAPSGAAVQAPADAGPTILFSSVKIERMSALPEASPVDDPRLLGAAEPYLNRPVSLEELRELGTEMEGIFRDAGYPYVRVVLPPQEIVGGSVRFQVIEGWIEGVSVLGDSPIAKAQTEARLAELNGKGPLSLDDVESTVALLNRVPGLKSRVSIARGGQGPGAMRLIADSERADPRVLLNVQNFGSRSLGREGTTLFAHLPGWAPYGDELELALFNTWQPDEQISGQLSYLRGLTADGLTAKIWGSYAEAEPGGTVAILGPTSESLTGGVEFEQPLYLTRQDTVSAYAGFEFADLNGELFQGAVPLSEDKTRVAYAGLEGEASWLDWTYTGRVEVRKGLDLFDASRAGDNNLARTDADPQAWLGRGEMTATSPSFWGLEAEVEISGQLANKPLMAIEEFSFGNYTVGRGYDPGAAAGDSAIAGALTLSGFEQEFWGGRLHVEPMAFYDVGRYWNEDSTGVEARTLASAGGGLRLTLNKMVRADVTYAHPLDQPLGIGESRPGGRVLFSITADGMALWDELVSLFDSLGEAHAASTL